MMIGNYYNKDVIIINVLQDFDFDRLFEFANDTCDSVSSGEWDMRVFNKSMQQCVERAAQLGEKEKRIIESIFLNYRNARDAALGKLDVLPEFFVKNTHGQDVVNPARLADYIAEREHFIFTKSLSDDKCPVYHYEDGVYVPINDTELRRLILGYIRNYKPDLRRTSVASETAALLAAHQPLIDLDALDGDENIINFANGILRLDTMTLEEHSPERTSTVRVNVDWTDETIDTPLFDGFLNDISGGEEEIKTLLREYIGACLSNVPGYKFKKALFQVGPGNVGKTLLMNLTKKLIGKNASTAISFSELENNRFASSRLYGKRLSGCSDLSVLPLNDISVFKMLTGGDEISAEFKGKASFTFVYKGFLWFCTNKMPKFGGDNGKWVFDRMIILPCPNVIPPEKRDKELLDKLCCEAKGIVRQCILAFREALMRGYEFTLPLEAYRSASETIADNDPMIRFYTECCTARPYDKTPDDRCTTAFIYSYYKKWCFDNFESQPLSRTDFKKRIADMYHTTPEQVVLHSKYGNYYPFVLKDAQAIELKETAYQTVKFLKKA